MTAAPELWLPVVGFEGEYEVSDQGRVRSFQKKSPKILKPGPTSTGHLTVALGRGNSRTVHSLVTEAFVGPCPPGEEIRHLDGNEKNNRLANLKYGTRSRNGLDKKWHRGASTYKLTPSDVLLIKQGLDAGVSGANLAVLFDVSQAAISSIKLGRTHADVV